MYAVIKVGGKQYKVEQGQTLLVDRQPHEPGKLFTPPVLMTGGDEVVTDGTKLDGAVTAQVVEHLRGEKIKVFTFKPKRAPAKKAADEKPAEKAAAAPAKKPAAKKPAAKKPAAAKKPPARKAPEAAAADKPKPARKPRATKPKEDTGDGA